MTVYEIFFPGILASPTILLTLFRFFSMWLRYWIDLSFLLSTIFLACASVVQQSMVLLCFNHYLKLFPMVGLFFIIKSKESSFVWLMVWLWDVFDRESNSSRCVASKNSRWSQKSSFISTLNSLYFFIIILSWLNLSVSDKFWISLSLWQWIC